MTPGKAKYAASLIDFMTHPEWKHSTSSAQTAFQLANDTNDDIFTYLAQRPDTLAQWSSSVRSMGNTYEAALLTDYPWKSLGSRLIIDTGGGHGGLVLSLAKILLKCHFLIQDLPEVVLVAERNVESSLPGALEAGRIRVQEYDFFKPQPKATKDAVWTLRYILHNWSDDNCIKILRNIRSAAGPENKILIIERVEVPATVSHGCSTVGADGINNTNDANGSLPPKPELRLADAPSFVPANYGASAKMPLALGLHMMATHNSYDRTMSEWERIIRRSGLEIAKVHTLRAFTSVIECRVASGLLFSDEGTVVHKRCAL